MRGEHPPAYLADGTHAFPFSTQAFAGIGAQLPVFAVGALVTVHGIMAADTLTARDPLRGRRGEERLKAWLLNMCAPSSTASIILVGWWNLQPWPGCSTLACPPGRVGQILAATIIPVSSVGALIRHLTSPKLSSFLRAPRLHPTCWWTCGITTTF